MNNAARSLAPVARSAWMCYRRVMTRRGCRAGTFPNRMNWNASRMAGKFPLAIVALLLALSTAVAAEPYPTRPVRLIIPFPAGGSNDVVGRLVANQLGERLGQQVFVDNRAGAGGVIGTEAAASAPADGYTLLIVSIAHAANPALYKLNYDPIK